MQTRLIDKLFGRSFGWRWLAWFALAFTLIVVTRDCRLECSPTEWLLKVALGLLGWSLLIVGVWLNIGGVAQIRTYLHLRKVRRQLDPLAQALGATVKCRWDGVGRCTVFYTFTDGNIIAVPVGPGGGYNPWTPNWNPGSERHTPGFEVLLAAAHRVCETPTV